MQNLAKSTILIFNELFDEFHGDFFFNNSHTIIFFIFNIKCLKFLLSYLYSI